MSKARLGSWESEAGVGRYFSGWLGLGQGQEYQEDLNEQEEDWQNEGDEVGVQGGGVQPLQQELQDRDRGPEARREELAQSDITTDILSGRSGSANAGRYIPGQFLKQHPYLKRYIKDKKSDLGEFSGLPSSKALAITAGLLALGGAVYWHFSK